jgi:ethanolamine ammonia-lyase small subunit
MDDSDKTDHSPTAGPSSVLPTSTEIVTGNPWFALRQFTDARIALGRCGISQPSTVHLDFQLAHAQARDAVYCALDVTQLAQKLEQVWPGDSPCLTLHSAVTDRQHYLQRPDLGRRLGAASRAMLMSQFAIPSPVTAMASAHDFDVQMRPTPRERPFDLALVVVDGLSALAIENHAAPFLAEFRSRLVGQSWQVAPVCIVQQGRVAIGDEIGQLLGAKAVVVLIGERPGLSSPDSMGLYMTWMPEVGLTDARRNCISNIRAAGLSYAQAAGTLHALLEHSRSRQISGVDLKDESVGPSPTLVSKNTNFLLK